MTQVQEAVRLAAEWVSDDQPPEIARACADKFAAALLALVNGLEREPMKAVIRSACPFLLSDSGVNITIDALLKHLGLDPT